VRRIAAVLSATAALLATTIAAATANRNQDRFNHAKHAKLFPLCSTCHEGVLQTGSAMFPVARDCVSCHDGTIQPRVEFTPPSAMTPSNLRFTHEVHGREALRANPSDSTIRTRCQACHAEPAAPRMEVRHTVVGNCLTCHKLPAEHLAVPDSSCTTCHLPLARATQLARADVARFPKPPSHDAPGFELAGHGRLAAPAHVGGVSGSCATCHAREFCITCHVNAPEVAAIQALEPDARSTAIAARLPTPASHREPEFATAHARAASAKGATCASCHTRQSCAACHQAPAPRQVAALPAAGPGRGPGAAIERRMPATHTAAFREGHGPEASARSASCSGCHIRAQCLDCHRPDPSGQNPRQAYHPAAFVTRHPAAAWSRQANCSDCHNPGQFCQTCHLQSGLSAGKSRLGAKGYHDAIPNFSLGHGQAARQSLESCASCHAERDCTACHSSVAGGFRFSPHGPGFNPDRLLKKNPSLCVACHGTSIPQR